MNKRIKIKVDTLSFDGFHLCITDESVMNGNCLFIYPAEIEWFAVYDTGRSVHHRLNIGTIIECDGNINPATRHLHNVKIIK